MAHIDTISLVSENKRTESSIYVVRATTFINFSAYASPKLKFRFEARIENGLTSGDVRLYDATNAQELAYVNITNNTFQEFELDVPSPPSGVTKLELQLKVNGGTGVEKIIIKGAVLEVS